jgi:hypothetical protein
MAASTIPSKTRALNYGLASFLIVLPALIGLYSWAT